MFEVASTLADMHTKCRIKKIGHMNYQIECLQEMSTHGMQKLQDKHRNGFVYRLQKLPRICNWQVKLKEQGGDLNVYTSYYVQVLQLRQADNGIGEII